MAVLLENPWFCWKIPGFAGKNPWFCWVCLPGSPAASLGFLPPCPCRTLLRGAVNPSQNLLSNIESPPGIPSGQQGCFSHFSAFSSPLPECSVNSQCTGVSLPWRGFPSLFCSLQDFMKLSQRLIFNFNPVWINPA